MTPEAKAFITQMQYQQIEIDQLERKLEELHGEITQYGVDGVSGSSPNFPFVKHSIIVAGYYQSETVQKKIESLGEAYQAKLEKLYDSRREVENILNEVKDAKARAIIRYRYVDGLEWNEVADKLGGRNTEDSVRKYMDRFFEKIA